MIGQAGTQHDCATLPFTVRHCLSALQFEMVQRILVALKNKRTPHTMHNMQVQCVVCNSNRCPLCGLALALWTDSDSVPRSGSLTRSA